MPAFLITLLCAAELILFLLPGFAIVKIVSRKCELSAHDSLTATIAVSATLGYLAFWIYLANKSAGQIFSYGVLLASLITLAHTFRQKRPLFILRSDFIIPLVYAFCLSLFYLSLLYLFVNPVKAGVDVANVRFFSETRPGDNIIPFIFAERIYDRAPIRPFCCGDWLSSDRPPLQAGIFLLQRPLRVAGNTGLQYQVLGTLLQCLWLCGVWSFLRALGVRKLRLTQALGLLAFSGFLFYNSVYVWPKLLAASFILFVFAILARAALERRVLSWFEAVLAALCFVLALLAHPGSVFSAPATAIFLIFRRNLWTLRHAAAALLILAAASLPWTLYQKFYDPPGNRLLKMHLAGVMKPDARGTFEAIRDAYGGLSPQSIVRYKWGNIKTLVGNAPLAWRGTPAGIAQREYIWNAIGVLNFGWMAALALWITSRRGANLPYAGAMICAAVLNLLVWCVVLFGPAQTLTEHGSYADILLLSLGLIGFLLTAPRIAAAAMLFLQAINLIFIWVAFRPVSFTLPSRVVVGPSLQWPMLVLAACTGGALFWHFGTSYFARDSAAPLPNTIFEQKPQ